MSIGGVGVSAAMGEARGEHIIITMIQPAPRPSLQAQHRHARATAPGLNTLLAP